MHTACGKSLFPLFLFYRKALPMARSAPTFTRKQIVDDLVSLGAELGRTPSKIEFQAKSGVKQNHLEKHFECWNDALAAANLPANVVKTNNANDLLDDWGFVTRTLGHCPQLTEYRFQGKYGGNTFRRRFNSWPGVGRAFYKRSAEDPQWQDVIKLIRDREACGTRPWLISPEFQIKPIEIPAANAASITPSIITYGEPIDFAFFRNAPVNEAGVVYLFGCLAHKLGYIVEAIQTNFPDCEAKRKDPDNRLRRVRIEFEFESKNFQLHKHDPAACDVIVCWRHNWEGCPLHVIDLSVELEKLKQPAA